MLAFPTIIALSLIAIAIMAHLVCGFGARLLAFPAALLVIEPAAALTLTLVLGLFLTFSILLEPHSKSYKNALRNKNYWLMLIISLPAIAISTLFLYSIPEHMLKVIFGVLILTLTIWQAIAYWIDREMIYENTGQKIEDEDADCIPPRAGMAFSMGIMSGIMNSTVCSSGPLLASWFNKDAVSIQGFRQTMSFAIFFQSIATLIAVMASGQETFTAIPGYFGFSIIAIALVCILTVRYSPVLAKLSHATYIKTVLALSAIASIWTLGSGLIS